MKMKVFRCILSFLFLLLFGTLIHAQNLESYEQKMQYCEQLLNSPLTTAEREEIIPIYVSFGIKLGWEYTKSEYRRYDDARRIYERVYPYASPDKQHLITQREAITWYFEGLHFQNTQKYEVALSCLEIARAGFHKTEAKEYEMHTLCHIGEVKDYLYDYEGAFVAFQCAESLAVRENDIMNILTKQIKLCEKVGNYESMAIASEKMEAIVSVSESVAMRFDYNDARGDQAMTRQQYAIAERWYLKNDALLDSLSLRKYGYRHYTNLRTLYSHTGEWNRALYYAMKVKDENQKELSYENIGYYLPYGAIANIYRLQGDSLSCAQYLDSLSCALRYTDEPRDLQYIYKLRGLAYSTFGNYGKALEEYKTAARLLAASYGEHDGDWMWLLPLMAGMEHRTGQMKDAVMHYRKYAEYTKSVSGEDSHDYVDALGYLANAEAFAGDTTTATWDYINASRLLKKLIRNGWPYMTQTERKGYWSDSSELLQNMTPFALKAKEFQTSFTTACYDGLILTKSFLLASERSTYEQIRRSGEKEYLDEFSNIQAMHEKVRTWEKSPHEYADSILEATSNIYQLESRLAKHCRSFGDATSFMTVDYEIIKGALGENEVLLDFTDFVSQSRGRIYAAYLINNKQQYPLLKELFPETDIDFLRVRYPYQYYSGLYADTLRFLIWEPFKDCIAEGATVYYVPSSFLFQVALESIPTDDGTLLGDHYHFVRLSSSRELVNYESRLKMRKNDDQFNAALYGGLQYSIEDMEMQQEARKHDVPRIFTFRGEEGLVRGDSLFRDLPGSKTEIEWVGKILENRHLSVRPFQGKEGTEESFLSLSGKAPQILHMATHGFYYTPDVAQQIDYLRGYTDAMSLSGLILAGGNAAWRGRELPKGVLDGILTAADIARMDLSGVEMVVLSACHSGRGEATPEGLYGLQRAFKKAGAKTIVMSLWAESDVVGPEFMAAFYQNLTGKDNWNKQKAFNQAKNFIRNKYPDTPSFWAGFIMLD